MKTTLEIDDDLYRELKVLSALSGRKLKDLVNDGLRQVLAAPAAERSEARNVEAGDKLRQWFKTADEAMGATPDGPSCRELLAAERRRLEEP